MLACHSKLIWDILHFISDKTSQATKLIKHKTYQTIIFVILLSTDKTYQITKFIKFKTNQTTKYNKLQHLSNTKLQNLSSQNLTKYKNFIFNDA